ncbi:hypothetical protein [Alkaliphilus crotonatoxidans]
MGGFKVICSNCGSEKVIEKSEKNKLDWVGDKVKYGQGIQRKCLYCNNQSFIINKTWLEKDPMQ